MVSGRVRKGIEGPDRTAGWAGLVYSRFCLYESFLFLTLLDVVAAGTGAALLAMPKRGDELDCCRRAHPSQLKGTIDNDDDEARQKRVIGDD